MVDVCGEKRQERGRGMRGIACRNVKLVCGDDAELGIPEFPPELMADDDDLKSTRRFGASWIA